MTLPILILNPHPRCNCRCAMCDIWKTTERGEFTVADVERQAADLAALGVGWVVLSGGEALMHSDLFGLCAELRRRPVRISLLSSGLLLERHAAAIVQWMDDVIVSLDGPPAIHDRIRGIPSAFASLMRGVVALRMARQNFPVTGRSTIQRLNCGSLGDTVDAARAAGLDTISFLGADVTSEAFNRPGGWASDRERSIAPGPAEIALLEREIDRLAASGLCGGFVVESERKLRRIVSHFRAHLGMEKNVAPRCNAPWVSAVVEANGEVRPCFFHKPYGRLTAESSLLAIVNGSEARAFRDRLDVSTNEICRRCVCSLHREQSS